MLTIRRANDRGKSEHGWLKSQHSFSFADYYDPAHMGFGTLRVINEDRIKGGTGFGAHPHRDMEIISCVVDGALEHQDSMGNKTIIRPGEVQRMSAGTGVVHSEYNPDADVDAHFLQIWITPKVRGMKPGYGQKDFADALTTGALILAVSLDGREGSIPINQDADVYVARLKANSHVPFRLRSGRQAWLQVVKGSVSLLSEELQAGDGAALVDESDFDLVTKQGAEIILFDLTSHSSLD